VLGRLTLSADSPPSSILRNAGRRRSRSRRRVLVAPDGAVYIATGNKDGRDSHRRTMTAGFGSSSSSWRPLSFLRCHVSALEIAAVTFGLISVFLSTREHIWSWPTAIVNVGLYALLFFREKLYADMGLQVIYLILSVYGWYEWLYGGENKTELHVSRLTGRTAARLLMIATAGSVALGFVLERATDASLPWLDATLSAFSLVAQWMMTRKILENWLLWIILDVVYVAMFVFLKSLYLTGFQYAVFLALAVAGHVQWLRSYRSRAVGGTAAVVPL